MADILDPWRILQIPPTRDMDKVRQAYLKQARLHHPDQYRKDPIRYRQQEDRMKEINLAYQTIQAGRAPFPRANEPPSKTAARRTQQTAYPPACTRHRRPIVRFCIQCQSPLCPLCVGFSDFLCDAHWQKSHLKKHRGRALREWLPLIGGIVWLKSIGLSPGLVLWTVLGYLAFLGFFQLKRARWFGCLAVLLLPYSLVLAGLYSLYESLAGWNKTATDEPPPY